MDNLDEQPETIICDQTEFAKIVQALLENDQNEANGVDIRNQIYRRPDGTFGFIKVDISDTDPNDEAFCEVGATGLFRSESSTADYFAQESSEEEIEDPNQKSEEKGASFYTPEDKVQDAPKTRPISQWLLMLGGWLKKNLTVANASILFVVIGLVLYYMLLMHSGGISPEELLASMKFREADLSGMFPIRNIEVVRGFDFDDRPHRLGVVMHQNGSKQIWVPLPCSDSIFTVDVDKPETNWITFPVKTKLQPKAAQQVSTEEVAIASESGLHMADENGAIQYTIMEGKYSDVYFDGIHLYGLEYAKSIIKMAVKNETSKTWTMDTTFKLSLDNNCEHLNASCDDRFRTFLVHKKSFYVTSPSGFKILKYNKGGQLVDSYNHDHHLSEKGGSQYAGFSISTIDAKKTLALCSNFGLNIFLRKTSGDLHKNRLRKEVKYLWDFVAFADDLYVLHGKNRFSLTQLTPQSRIDEKLAQLNPQPPVNKYMGGRIFKGTYDQILKTGPSKSIVDLVHLAGASFRLGVIQFGAVTEFWVPLYEKNFIQVYTLKGIKSYEIYFPDFDFIHPVAVTQTEEDEVILASKIGLFCLDRYGVIQYKIIDGKFSDVMFNGNTLIAMEYSSNRIEKFSKHQGKWKENPKFSFGMKNIHLSSDSFTSLVVQRRHTFVASNSRYEVQKYSSTGILLETYHSEQKKAGQRWRQSLTIAGIDSKESVLLCDFYNNRLLTLSRDGKFKNYPIEGLRDVRDAVVLKNSLFILSGIASPRISVVHL